MREYIKISKWWLFLLFTLGLWVGAYLIWVFEFYGKGYKSTVPAIVLFFIGFIFLVYGVCVSDEIQKLNKTINKILAGKERRLAVVDSTYKKVREYAENHGLTDELKNLLTELNRIRKDVLNDFPS